MVSEMVERVARAMCPNEWAPGCVETQALLQRRKDAIKKAQAAIAAMRLPTLGMVIAGCRKANELGHRELADEYTAMIDAALPAIK